MQGTPVVVRTNLEDLLSYCDTCEGLTMDKGCVVWPFQILSFNRLLKSRFSNVLNHFVLYRSSKMRQELQASLDQLLAARHQAWKFFVRRRKAYRRSSCLVRQPVKLLSEPDDVFFYELCEVDHLSRA
jgi:hypothetical protein